MPVEHAIKKVNLSSVIQAQWVEAEVLLIEESVSVSALLPDLPSVTFQHPWLMGGC